MTIFIEQRTVGENKYVEAVVLPDGQHIDLRTRAGADALLQSPGAVKNIFAYDVRIGGDAHDGGDDVDKLIMTHLAIESLVTNSSPSLFQQKVTQRNLEPWIDRTIAELEKMTSDEDGHWQRTGELKTEQLYILRPCYSLFQHTDPSAMALKKGFFRVLAQLVEARTPLLPSALVCDMVCIFGSRAPVAIPQTPQKTLGELESCGFLAQYIRCSTVPYDPNVGGSSTAAAQLPLPPWIDKIYTELAKCTLLLKKKFKRGKPCGDILFNILNGTDGYLAGPKNEQLMTKLKAVAAYANILKKEPLLLGPNGTKSLHACYNCNKSNLSSNFQDNLKVCSRCHRAFYCSRKCQLDHWKKHKKTCEQLSKSEIKTSEANDQVLWTFAKTNHIDIMIQIAKVCNDTGLEKSDLLVEIDFAPDENGGTAPALQNPPKFKVKEAKKYYKDLRPNEPDWFNARNDPGTYESEIESLVTRLRQTHRSVGQQHIFCMARFPVGLCVGAIDLKHQSQCQQSDINFRPELDMFGNAVLDAFRSAIYDSNFGPLHNMFPDDYVQIILHKLNV